IKTGHEETVSKLSAVISGDELQWSLGYRDMPRGKSSHSKVGDIINHVNSKISMKGFLKDYCLPVLVYYGLDRGHTEIKYKEEWDNSRMGLAAYENCLDGTADFNSFYHWYKFREVIENSRKVKSDHEYSDKQLDAVRSALKKFKSLGAYSDIYIDLEASPQSLMIQKKIGRGKNIFLSINQMSAGEKSLITMVADIARRLALTRKSDILKGNGVVLIDEIELHLHPRWQTRVIDDLEKTFPNLQFIVTTHSPQVLNRTKCKSVYLLKQESKGIVSNGPIPLYGRESDEILEMIFEEPRRPSNINKKLDKYFRLIDQNKLAEAKKIRLALEKEIGIRDPEFTRADALIRWREILKK
ncbi:MAG TPA: ATP-binding protein, partial [Candidatus Cloacimonetes bacterium]|nr:ATP-binding protein [Candidatus Cloacimonadota bacterium]